MSMIDTFLRRPDFDIFPMETRDLAAVAELHALRFGRRWTAAEFHTLLLQDTVFGFVARQSNGSGRPATGGFVLTRSGGGEAEILTLGVDARHGRAGLGWRLMQAALGEARRSGAEVMFLEVDQTNVAAIGLYRRLGFAKVGERRAYYKGDGPVPGGADILRLDLVPLDLLGRRG